MFGAERNRGECAQGADDGEESDDARKEDPEVLDVLPLLLSLKERVSLGDCTRGNHGGGHRAERLRKRVRGEPTGDVPQGAERSIYSRCRVGHRLDALHAGEAQISSAQSCPKGLSEGALVICAWTRE